MGVVIHLFEQMQCNYIYLIRFSLVTTTSTVEYLLTHSVIHLNYEPLDALGFISHPTNWVVQ